MPPSDLAARTARPAASLRRRLLLWILGPLSLLIGLNAWVGYGHAVQAANEAYDRSLYLAARTLAEELAWRDGQLYLHGLRGVGYLFENHTGSRLLYKVETAGGRWLAGHAGLPSPALGEPSSVHYFALVRFEDARLEGQPVRLAQLIHAMEDARTPEPLLRITVVETLEARQQLIGQILRETLTSQGLLLLAAALLVVWGVQRGIRPVEDFRRQLDLREDADFTAIEPPDVPRELRPLIATLNGYLQRLARLIDIRKRFLDNAAHQLRTPLTALKTQLALAVRQAGPQTPAELLAAQRTTDDAVRLTEQLLAMTRVEHGREIHDMAPVDLAQLARQVTGEFLLRAHQRGDDLGLEVQGDAWQVSGLQSLLHEALANLIDNALHHGPAGVRVTVRVGEGWLEVEDDGPGIPPEHQAHVFERFYRAAPAGSAGSGLGLAIVREIALQHGASLSLTSPVHEGKGTRIRMGWPSSALQWPASSRSPAAR